VATNGGTVSSNTLAAVSTFCASIDAAGLRDRFYRLNLFCGNSDASLNAVRTPLYRGPSLTGTQYGGSLDTNNNFVQGDYAETGASGGLLGNGTTKYLDTGFAMNTLPSINSGHASLYNTNRSRTNAFRGQLGVNNGSSTIGFGLSSDANVYALWAGQAAAVPATANGFLVASRTNSNNLVAYMNGSSIGSTSTPTSGSLSSLEAVVFANRTTAGTAANYDAGRYQSYSIGTGLTTSEVSTYYTAILAFQTALGRN
jgi:hypothetical protein